VEGIMNKYKVFKYNEASGELGSEVTDAVVIRRQDFFAAPALNAYAHAIGIAVQAIKWTGVMPPGIADLQVVADYFLEQAELSAEEGYKFPD
jgi:hypothetical protein